MTNDDGNLLAQIAAIADPAASPDAIAEVRMKVRLDHWKQLAASVDEAMVEHIEATGRDLVIGNTRYWASHPTATSNRPERKRETLRALLDSCGGDLDALCDCLYSDPLKTSEAKARLSAEEFAALFVVEMKTKLSSGPVRKQLMQAWEPKR
jgi:hypothetical protein